MQENQNTPKSEVAKREEEILKFWKDNKIFEKTLRKESPKGEFVFYEGPPTANGRPGIHHVEARAFKDAIPRFKTMQGYHVRRKAGWDTHGLPVELEVEKELGISSKLEIEKFGIAKFNELCKKNVWKYVDEWHRFTERIGYFVDMEDAYVTYHNSYIESLWWVLKEIANKDLLYKDYKVVPWCPRCGTALSSHELAQGYADVKDLSVTIKFRLKNGEGYILAWTTTPWTLPGNVALAVGEEIVYVVVEREDDDGPAKFILAKDRLSSVFKDGNYKILEEKKGRDLIGLEYEPLYPYFQDLINGSEKEKLQNAFKIYAADFVTTEDGTGVVHTAVMYGQDDFELGSKVGLPKFHLVTETGHFISGMDFLSGRFVKDESVTVDIIKDLAPRGLLFDKLKFEHSYPHCWRCKTPLIYYARDSWYIKTSQVRNELLKENEKINWEPDHIKEGRFGEWLTNIRDWAISRERYWGTPLPIWMSFDGAKYKVIGSLDDLKEKVSAKNNYFLMRHGSSTHNEQNVLSSKESNDHHLTEGGREEVAMSVKAYAGKIDLIITSPLKRTKETAEIARDTLGLSVEAVVVDERLREAEWGEFEGKSSEEYHAYFSSMLEKFSKEIPGGENLSQVKKRLGELLYELERQYGGKNILLVTHEYPAWLLFAVAHGSTPEQAVKEKGKMEDFLKCADFVTLPFVPLPHNENYELDLHRPYIDEISWEEDGVTYTRTPEVMDVWFDSGAMPFAQDHYPFDFASGKKFEGKNLPYPADFISEAIDQTRGWFYTLHAIGVLLGRGRAYNNVICLGHVLDKNGLKMSKSKGNTVSPWELADKYGIDVLRFWMYSINQPGESKNFDEKTVEDVSRKVFNLLGNSLSFYKMYASGMEDSETQESENVLDKWIMSKIEILTKEVTVGLSAYRLFEPTRNIRDFIADFSQWYVRRSRDRFKDKTGNDYKSAVATMRLVLKKLSIILAPFAPFFAEYLYSEVKGVSGRESVHLEDWPELLKDEAVFTEVLDLMEETRKVASLGLEARSSAGMKVRQPLSSLTLKSSKLSSHTEYLEIIKDEVNIKDVKFDESISGDILLDMELTPQLVEEGEVRDLIREIQEQRKKNNFVPEEVGKLKVLAGYKKQEIIKNNWEEIRKAANLSEAVFDSEVDGDFIVEK